MTQTIQYQTAKLIDAAADTIEATGWCRGRYRDGDRHCTLGALRDANWAAGLNWYRVAPDETLDIDLVYYRAYDAVTAEVRRQPDVTDGSISGWNDAQRDRRKVVRLLRRTARKVRRGQIPVR